jgi:predicted transcriptional regulator
MDSPPAGPDFLGLTARIVAAFVQKNALPAAEVPALIERTHQALTGLGKAGEADAAAPVPAVPVKKSVFPDFIICLEDGKKLKMLKRHLATSYHMTPEQYRQKWRLPADYPLVAPNYAARRSTLAKKIGLGRRRTEPPAPEPVAVPPATATGRGRRRAAPAASTGA